LEETLAYQAARCATGKIGKGRYPVVSSLERGKAGPVGLAADSGEVEGGHVEIVVVVVVVVVVAEGEEGAVTAAAAVAAAAVAAAAAVVAADVAETAAACVAAQEAVADRQLTCPALAPSEEHGLEAALQLCCEGHEACSYLVKLRIR